MIIRQAQAEDAEAIAAITNEIIRDTLVTFTTIERCPDDIATDIAKRGAAYQVAEKEGQVLGFATYGPFRGGPGYAQSCEHSIQLLRQARGRGVGRALMVALESVAKTDGKHVMVAGISSANPGAEAFHRSLGFAHVGRLPEVGVKWGKRLDLILMQKILVPDGWVAPDTGAPER